KRRDLPDQNCGAAPLISYTLGWLHEKLGDKKSAHEFYKQAAAESPDYCFPSRLAEIRVLESACARIRATPARLTTSAICFTTGADTKRPSDFGNAAQN